MLIADKFRCHPQVGPYLMQDKKRLSSVAAQVAELLADFQMDDDSAPTVQQAVHLARQLQIRANALQTTAERRQQAELDRMIQSPHDKATLLQLTDQAFRARLPHRAADQLIHILDVQGIPRFFSALDRTLLKGFQSFGSYLPSVAMPFVQEKMRQETANVVLPAEPEFLSNHLRQRHASGVRMNVNYLGEALLGERDAERRLQRYVQALQCPDIEVISVKISTIYSQISALSREHSIDVLCDRMERLYRAAAQERFRQVDGSEVAKFVYLDMEEYRDKEITAEVFIRTLSRPGLEQVRGGIVLQAYIPDSWATQQRITHWARQRLAAGGAPITLRIVKGANLEMERVEASLRGWPQAPYQEKRQTDANYNRMLAWGMQPENLSAVRLGIASHNLFTLAYGLVLAYHADAWPQVQFEMLEGMANHQRRALFEFTHNLLLYAPACRQAEFVSAIGYLIRRLDENTGPENFLRHAFRLEVDSPDWQALEDAFVASFEHLETIRSAPRRTQNRQRQSDDGDQNPETSTPPTAAVGHGPAHSAPNLGFTNEPDTDWSLPHHSQWAEDIVARWKSRHGPRAETVPLVVAGEEIATGRELCESIDPSRPETVVGRYFQARAADVATAVTAATADPDAWRRRPAQERCDILQAVTQRLAAQRAELLGVMLAEGGKTLSESDPEVSEAIDFCRFYAQSAGYFHELAGLAPCGSGVVVVVSPWNFPLAIPCGGIAAALAAGNTVILKPASDTVLIAYHLCQCFWQAGVPRTALQFLPCPGATVGSHLVTHPGVARVLLTGGTETALHMLRAKPSLQLLAETGGKNATIVTALADREQAIKNVLHSAFSHSGQKCSATSLLILEEEVYHDAQFREALCDALESLAVGSAWQLQTKVGPLIRPPTGVLERSLTKLEPEESWAVRPQLRVHDNPHSVSPGLKWDVQPQSFTHLTEFFGPLLAVLPARDLHAAIDLVNATGYGLTAGLESLDDREQQLWQEGVRAGNLYINRPTTGAIVLRQPFGGLGKSAVGPGLKAGGPNYVVPLMHFQATGRQCLPPARTGGRQPSRATARKTMARSRWSLESLQISESPTMSQIELDDFYAALRASTLDPAAVAQIVSAAESYLAWMATEFGPTHDEFRLLGEDNYRRYRPLTTVHIRLHSADTPWELFARALAARVAGCRIVISSPPLLESSFVQLLDQLTHGWAGQIEFVPQSDTELADAIRASHIHRLRYAAPDRVPLAIRQAAAETGHYLADAPVLAHGRIELLWYFQEQSLSQIYHRYGNLGPRAAEVRHQPA